MKNCEKCDQSESIPEERRNYCMFYGRWINEIVECDYKQLNRISEAKRRKNLDYFVK